jgi:ring-1,2-phenylacetyl-CoA epoxidase subunit PaaC
LTNVALDLVGQSRALLTHAGTLEGAGHDEDQLAFLRDERDYLNVTLVELPNGSSGRGDFAFTTLRNFVMATFMTHLWVRLSASSDEALAAIAGKAVKEARYHRTHAAEWVVRLGDGTDESRRRLDAARERLWPYVDELFLADEVDDAAEASGLGPRWSDLHAAWLADVAHVFDEATLQPPVGRAADGRGTALRAAGKRGRHSEHMGFLLAEMQHLQRTFPGGTW